MLSLYAFKPLSFFHKVIALHIPSQPAGADVVTKRTVLVMKPLSSQYRSQQKPPNDL